MRQIGKQGRINLKANKILKEIYIDKGIQTCELRLSGCWINSTLGFAHRKKRVEYYKTPEKLSDFNETVLACTSCHQKIEGDRELTDFHFNRLRNENNNLG